MKQHIYVSDQLISLARKLPNRLYVKVGQANNFALQFLLGLSDDQLSELSKASKKKGSENFTLYFFEKKEGSEECPREIRSFSKFSLDNVKEISFNGDTQPYLHSKDCYEDYVSVILVTA